MDFSQAVAQLSHKDVKARLAAVETLAELGDKRAVEPLIGVLHDENAEVRYAAIFTLAGMGDKRAVEPLIVILGDMRVENGYHRYVAERALEKLGELDFAKWAAPLRYGDSYMRRYAAEMFAKLQDMRAVELLITALLHDEEMRVRSTSAFALREIGDVRAVKPLIAALYDDKARVRCIAAKALGKLRDVSAVKPLIKLLEDDADAGGYGTFERVCHYAVEALEAIDTHEARTAVAHWCETNKRPEGPTIMDM